MISSIPIIKLISCEPSAAHVTKSSSRRLPHLNDFTEKLNFRYKSRSTLLLGKSVQRFLILSDDRTKNRQTEKQRLQIYTYRYSLHINKRITITFSY